jgi:NAD(P)-dependent dehydrogenase (short-subunit alcohol dehydrogenase family)
MADFPLAIVTGGAHRLGRAFALTLAYQGYAVLLHYHTSGKAAQKTASEIRTFGAPAFPVCADLTRPEQVRFLFDTVDSLLATPDSGVSRLAVLVNSAAVMPRGEVKTLPLADWDAALDLNLKMPFLCAQQAALRMNAGGLIVNVSDVGAGKAWSGFPSYTVSKAALESLTRVLARSLAPSIRVNAIAPGLVLPPETLPIEEWNRLVERLPLKRPAATEEVALALEFLLKNEYITGQTIVVDGGYSLL